MHKLDLLVKEMLETHVGGEIFFDHFDEAVRNNYAVIDSLIESIPNLEEKNIILSGKFGKFFLSYLNLLNINTKKVILVRGGLRKSEDNTDIFNILSDKCDKCYEEYIFIDDSYYSGKTKNAIAIQLSKLKSRITDTYVVYDGSHTKEEDVHSLYRYYK